MVMQPNHGQYDFITNSGQAAKKPLIPGGNSKKGRIIIAAAGAVGLLFIIMIVISLLGQAGRGDTQALVTAAKQQQELIRVAEVGIDKARGQDAKNIAVTTKLALASQQIEMQAAIEAAGLKPKDVLGTANNETDKTLEAAEQNNRFDEVFITVMDEGLLAYQQSVKRAFDSAKSKKLREALLAQYTSASTLAGETRSE